MLTQGWLLDGPHGPLFIVVVAWEVRPWWPKISGKVARSVAMSLVSGDQEGIELQAREDLISLSFPSQGGCLP